MSMITSRIRNALGTARRLVCQTEAEALSKLRESFLTELKEITEEKKKPGYHERYMTAVASMDGFTTPQIIAKPRNLIWDYESKSKEVVNWLGGVALNKDEDQDYRAEAIYCFEHTDNPRAIDYLIECLRDENSFVSDVALGVITKKLFFRSVFASKETNPLENIKINVDEFLKAAEEEDRVVDKLKIIARSRQENLDLLIQRVREQGMPQTKANIKAELARPRKELMSSLVQEYGEPRAKHYLIRIALDDYYENHDAQHQAFLVLKENNGLEDLITYIRERFREA